MQDYIVRLHRGVYAIQWREGGKQKRVSLGTADKQEANRLAREVARQDDLNAVETFTIQQLWTRYRASLEGRPAHTTMGYEEKSILPFFGGLKPNAIDDKLCEAYIERRRALGRKDATITTELTRLSNALAYAVTKNWITGYPAIRRPPPAPPKERFLTKDEARRFVDAIKKPHLRLFVLLALFTAARREAILGLTWDRVDLGARRIDLRDPEANRPMKDRAIVPIGDQLYEELVRAHNDAETPFVISWQGERVDSVKSGLREAGKRSKVEGVTAHVFRHTAAVWMAESRIPMEEIAQYLGHRDHGVTERVYARFSPDYLRGAANALSF